MLQKDLDKPQVVKMLIRCFDERTNWRYCITLADYLLFSVGPKTKSYRAVQNQIQAEINQRIQKKHDERTKNEGYTSKS